MRMWLNPAHGPLLLGLAEWTGRWKFPAVGRFAGDRPLVWFDDDFDLYPGARDAFLARRSERVKLVRVDPHVGITEGQVAEVERWLRVAGAR